MSLKRIFDGLYVDQLFQRNERGETIFYPFGLMGRAYRVPEAREAELRQAMRWLMLTALVSGSIVFTPMMTLGLDERDGLPFWLVGGGALALLLAVLTGLQLRLAKGLEPVPHARPSAGEWLRRGRQARAPWTYWACLGLGIFCFALGAGGIGLAGSETATLLSGLFMLWWARL